MCSIGGDALWTHRTTALGNTTGWKNRWSEYFKKESKSCVLWERVVNNLESEFFGRQSRMFQDCHMVLLSCSSIKKTLNIDVAEKETKGKGFSQLTVCTPSININVTSLCTYLM